MSRCRILAYVRHHQIDGYRKAGWIVLDDLGDCYHGQFSILMGWVRESEPVLPPK